MNILQDMHPAYRTGRIKEDPTRLMPHIHVSFQYYTIFQTVYDLGLMDELSTKIIEKVY